MLSSSISALSFGSNFYDLGTLDSNMYLNSLISRIGFEDLGLARVKLVQRPRIVMPIRHRFGKGRSSSAHKGARIVTDRAVNWESPVAVARLANGKIVSSLNDAW